LFKRDYYYLYRMMLAWTIYSGAMYTSFAADCSQNKSATPCKIWYLLFRNEHFSLSSTDNVNYYFRVWNSFHHAWNEGAFEECSCRVLILFVGIVYPSFLETSITQ